MVSERANKRVRTPPHQQQSVAGPLPLTVAAGLAALWLSRSRREVDVGGSG
jgi:hypothetical protein